MTIRIRAYTGLVTLRGMKDQDWIAFIEFFFVADGVPYFSEWWVSTRLKSSLAAWALKIKKTYLTGNSIGKQ